MTVCSSSERGGDTKYRHHRRFVHRTGILWLAHDWLERKEECVRGDAFTDSDAT